MNITGRYTVEIFRANGKVEQFSADNLVPDSGTEEFAKLLLGEASSSMAYMAVGTGTTATSMASIIMQGEQARVALSANASSLNTMVQVATFGGASESLTGIGLNEVGIFNHANSGEGEMGSRLVYASSTVTLAQSDLVKFEVVTTVGSHS